MLMRQGRALGRRAETSSPFSPRMASSDSLRNVTTMVIKKPSQSPFAFKDQPAETDIGDARDFAQICLNKPIPKFGWR